MQILTRFVRRPVVLGAVLAAMVGATCGGNQEALRRQIQSAPESSAAGPADGAVPEDSGGAAPEAAPTDAAVGESGPAARVASGGVTPQTRAGQARATGTPAPNAAGPAAPGGSTPGTRAGASSAAAPSGGAAPAGGAALSGAVNPGATDVGVTGEKVLIGGVWFHESYLDRYSRVAEHAARAFFNEINRAGGIHGRKIEYVSCVDGGDTSRARACFKDLVENKKVFMMGPTISWATGTIQDYIKSQKIPFVGSFGLYLEEFKNDNLYSFPAQVPVYEIARLFGKFLIETVKPATVGISYLNIEAAQECMKGLEEYLGKGGVKVVAKVGNEFDEPDLTPQVLKMRQANPDIVAFCNDPVNNAKFVGVAARAQRYKPRLGWIGGWPTVPEFGKIVGDWGVGHYGFSSVCYHEAPECDADPDVKLFKTQLDKHYPGEIERMHYYGQNMWCGAKMIAEALRLAGPNLTRLSLLQALDSGKFFGWTCQGMQTFYKANVREGSKGGQMLQLDQSGRWRLVKPTYRAD
ncbi:MAG: ABC transporter substrate-binding protein [Actinomycetota bacterium]